MKLVIETKTEKIASFYYDPEADETTFIITGDDIEKFAEENNVSEILLRIVVDSLDELRDAIVKDLVDLFERTE